jgi:WD40 repeat protein
MDSAKDKPAPARKIFKDKIDMKRFAFCLILFLAACAPRTIPPVATETSLLPTFSPTATIPATHTFTPLPTDTATPQPLPTLTSTPRPAIHSGNAGRLARINQLPHPDVRSLAFSPDSTWLLIASGDPSRGNFLVTLWWPDQNQKYDLATATGTVWGAAFSPDGKRVAYVFDNPSNTLRGYVVDVATKKQIATELGDGTAYCLAFSPDGTRLALGGSDASQKGAIWVYDTSTWEMVRVLTAKGQNVLALVFSPDGSTLYSSGTDGAIRVWSMGDGTLLNHFTYKQQANSLALSPDGGLLASIYCTTNDAYGCTKGGVVIWHAADGKMLKSFTDLAYTVAFSPDGGLLATGGGSHDSLLRFRYAATWDSVGENQALVERLAFSPDGRLLATADYETVTIWAIQ